MATRYFTPKTFGFLQDLKKNNDRPWFQENKSRYEKDIKEQLADAGLPEPLPILREMRNLFSRRYGRAFDSIGFNLYRDGRDSVAWHGDRHRRQCDRPGSRRCQPKHHCASDIVGQFVHRPGIRNRHQRCR